VCALLAAWPCAMVRGGVGISAAMPVVDGVPTLFAGDRGRTHLVVNRSTLPKNRTGGKPTCVLGEQGFACDWSIAPSNGGIRVSGGDEAEIQVDEDFRGERIVTITVTARWEWVYLDWQRGPEVVEVGREESRDTGSLCVRVTALDVDLDVDANHDGLIDDADDGLEENPGVTAARGGDVGARHPGGILIPLALRVNARADAGGRAILETAAGEDRFRVWADQDRVVGVDLPAEWRAGEVPERLYVEPAEADGDHRDIVLQLRWKPAKGGATAADRVAITTRNPPP